jgi:ribose transport system substrate-binding protein
MVRRNPGSTIWSLAFCGALLLAAGCGNSSDNPDSSGAPSAGVSADGSDDSTPQGTPRKLRIAVIPKGTSHDFWKSVHYGAQQAAEELGVEIIWQGTLDEKDKEGQINIVDQFILKRVDGICLAPIDRTALVSVVQSARTRGIPTVIFDSGLEGPENYVSYVATDNYQGGVLGARRLGELLQGQGNVILLRYQAGSESTEQREQGFLDTLAKEFPRIAVLSENQRVDSSDEQAKEVADALLLKYKTQVNGVFTVCEPNNRGMLLALRTAQLAGRVKFVGFDTDPAFVEALRQGEMHGIVLQDPVKMGYLAVKTMVDHLRGQQVPPRISTGEYLATPDNMDSPEIHALLHPAKLAR